MRWRSHWRSAYFNNGVLMDYESRENPVFNTARVILFGTDKGKIEEVEKMIKRVGED
jgi:hypothetical protein